jgi:hypothetical protein
MFSYESQGCEETSRQSEPCSKTRRYLHWRGLYLVSWFVLCGNDQSLASALNQTQLRILRCSEWVTEIVLHYKTSQGQDVYMLARGQTNGIFVRKEMSLKALRRASFGPSHEAAGSLGDQFWYCIQRIAPGELRVGSMLASQAHLPSSKEMPPIDDAATATTNNASLSVVRVCLDTFTLAGQLIGFGVPWGPLCTFELDGMSIQGTDSAGRPFSVVLTVDAVGRITRSKVHRVIGDSEVDGAFDFQYSDQTAPLYKSATFTPTGSASPTFSCQILQFRTSTTPLEPQYFDYREHLNAAVTSVGDYTSAHARFSPYDDAEVGKVKLFGIVFLRKTLRACVGALFLVMTLAAVYGGVYLARRIRYREPPVYANSTTISVVNGQRELTRIQTRNKERTE